MQGLHSLPCLVRCKGMAKRWMAERDLAAGAPVRLFCLPHAGSGAALFYRWKRALPGIAVVPVLLPGREARFAEPPVESVDAVVAALMDVPKNTFDRPYAIFGHSMGALLAYAWAQAIRRASLPAPVALFLSGRNAAHRPQPHRRLHELDDDVFLAALRSRYGGTANELLDDAETRQLFLPVLRADLKLVETYQHVAEPMFDCPIHSFAGSEDASVADEGLAAWAELTTGEFTQERPGGNHFYHLGASQKELLEKIRDRLGLKQDIH